MSLTTLGRLIMPGVLARSLSLKALGLPLFSFLYPSVPDIAIPLLHLIIWGLSSTIWTSSKAPLSTYINVNFPSHNPGPHFSVVAGAPLQNAPGGTVLGPVFFLLQPRRQPGAKTTPGK